MLVTCSLLTVLQLVLMLLRCKEMSCCSSPSVYRANVNTYIVSVGGKATAGLPVRCRQRKPPSKFYLSKPFQLKKDYLQEAPQLPLSQKVTPAKSEGATKMTDKAAAGGAVLRRSPRKAGPPIRYRQVGLPISCPSWVITYITVLVGDRVI